MAGRQWFLILILAACGHPPQLLPEELDLPAYCSTKVQLAPPPHDDHRTIPSVIAWARMAARTANAAMAERDQCAIAYAQMRAACSTAAGCIVPRKSVLSTQPSKMDIDLKNMSDFKDYRSVPK